MTPGEARAVGVGMICDDRGDYVTYTEYAKLDSIHEQSKEQYRGIVDTQLKVIDDLKAESERLKASAGPRDWIAAAIRNTHSAGDEVITVKASVSSGKTILPELIAIDRLLKAGDLLESMLHRFGESDNAAHAIREWQAAKKGDAK